MKVLHITSVESTFFRQQIRFLEKEGIQCDTVGALSIHTEETNNQGLRNRIGKLAFGHNPLYYGYKGSVFLPKVLYRSLRNDYDIIHINSGMVTPFGFLQPQRPLVISFWGSDVMGSRLFGAVPRVNRKLTKRSSATIVMNDKMKNYIPGEPYVIPHGIDTDLFRPIPQEYALKKTGWDKSKKHVLFLWNPSYEVKQYPLAESIVNSVNTELNQKVVLHPVFDEPHQKIPVYMNAADCLLLTSQREGSPNAVKEAIACNLPVVATDVGDVPDMLNGVHMSFIGADKSTLVNKIITVLRSDERSNGREHVDMFDGEKMASQLTSVYRDVLA